MIPCRRNDCNEWIDPTQGEVCAKCAPRKTAKTRSNRGYDALEMIGAGVVSPRRVLVHRPKSVRRSTPVNIYNDYSLSDMKDELELSRRTPTEHKPVNPNASYADTQAIMREKLRNIAGTIRMGEQD